MSKDTYLKDNIKRCVDYVMSKNDDDKRRIITGLFEYSDYLVNEQLVVQALNDKEKQEWFNNEMFDVKDKEIERLTDELNTCMIERNKFLDRIDKTLDFIDKEWGCDGTPIDDVINILKGDDKEC